MAGVVDVYDVKFICIGILTIVVVVVYFFFFKYIAARDSIKINVKVKAKKNKEKKEEKKAAQPVKSSQVTPKNVKHQKAPAQPPKDEELVVEPKVSQKPMNKKENEAVEPIADGNEWVTVKSGKSHALQPAGSDTQKQNKSNKQQTKPPPSAQTPKSATKKTKQVQGDEKTDRPRKEKASEIEQATVYVPPPPIIENPVEGKRSISNLTL